MRLKLFAVLIIIGFIVTDLFSGVYLRYNLLGYNPSRRKRVVVMSDENIKGKKWSIILTKNDSVVLSGTFGKSMYGKGDHTPMPYNYIVDITVLKDTGTYVFNTYGCEPETIFVKNDPYSWILSEPLHWLRAARCGSKDAVDHGLCHVGDTLCRVYHRVGMQNNKWEPVEPAKYVNGFGGWHDAGDYLKFTLTVSYTAYQLLRAYEIAPEVFTKKWSKTDLIDVLDEAKWGLDFLSHTMTEKDTNEFIIEIGDDEDHNIGNRLPENDPLNGKRPALCALSQTQMGYTAATLALGANIFKKIKGYEDVAALYEKRAKLIFRRALSKDAISSAWLQAEYHFYNDDTKFDNLELGAAELWRLTGDSTYLKKAIEFEDKARAAGWRAWESMNMPAHMRILKEHPIVKIDIKTDLDQFNAYARKPGNIWGVPLKYVWGGLYSYIGVGADALTYELLTGTRKYHRLGEDMLDYLFGLNNWGICFVATPKIGYTIKHPFSQIYALQGDKFPMGAISEGPGDKRSHDNDKRWFGFDETVEPTYKFNTDKGVFYDNVKDYMCMETTIAGVADGIYMIAIAAKMFRN